NLVDPCRDNMDHKFDSRITRHVGCAPGHRALHWLKTGFLRCTVAEPARRSLRQDKLGKNRQNVAPRFRSETREKVLDRRCNHRSPCETLSCRCPPPCRAAAATPARPCSLTASGLFFLSLLRGQRSTFLSGFPNIRALSRCRLSSARSIGTSTRCSTVMWRQRLQAFCSRQFRTGRAGCR